MKTSEEGTETRSTQMVVSFINTEQVYKVPGGANRHWNGRFPCVQIARPNGNSPVSPQEDDPPQSYQGNKMKKNRGESFS